MLIWTDDGSLKSGALVVKAWHGETLVGIASGPVTRDQFLVPAAWECILAECGKKGSLKGTVNAARDASTYHYETLHGA